MVSLAVARCTVQQVIWPIASHQVVKGSEQGRAEKIAKREGTRLKEGGEYGEKLAFWLYP